VDAERQDRAKEEGRERASKNDDEGGAGASAERVQVELDPDEEHEQDHTELRDDPELGRELGGKHPRRQARREEAEHRRPEHEPGYHLANDGRLMKSAK